MFVDTFKASLDPSLFKLYRKYLYSRYKATADLSQAEVIHEVAKERLSKMTEKFRKNESYFTAGEQLEVKMAGHILKDPVGMAAGFDKGLAYIFDYLAEEVLDQQTDDTRNLLLSTSILQQITPEVAERLVDLYEGGPVFSIGEAGATKHLPLDVRDGRRVRGIDRRARRQEAAAERQRVGRIRVGGREEELKRMAHERLIVAVENE